MSNPSEADCSDSHSRQFFIKKNENGFYSVLPDSREIKGKRKNKYKGSWRIFLFFKLDSGSGYSGYEVS